MEEATIPKGTKVAIPMAGLNTAVLGRRQSFAPVLMLLAVAMAAAVIAVMTQVVMMRLAASSVALTMAAMVFGLKFRARWAGRQETRRLAQLVGLVGQDATPCYVTDKHGQILYQNDAAIARFKSNEGGALVTALNQHFASPSSVLYRLQNRAAHSGFGREDVVTRRGHTRLAVHQIGDDRFLWRLEEFQDRTSAGRGAENLSLPMLTASKVGRRAVHQ